MPTFDFKCNDCDYEFEILVLNSNQLNNCPKCKSNNLKKIFKVQGHKSSFILKGKDYYSTNNRSN